MASIPNRFGDSQQNNGPEMREPEGSMALVGWIMSKVKYWREVRDDKYKARWEEYTRLKRGFWDAKDKNNDSERSKLIAPALQQALEMTVSEMEEATFNKRAWFDLEDDIADEEKEDALVTRDQLLEDFEMDGVPGAIARIYDLGGTYGTGIGKLLVSKKREYEFEEGRRVAKERISVELVPIRPDEFVIDTSALTVDEALGCAHELIKPLHSIRQKQAAGTYAKTEVHPYSGIRRANTTGAGSGQVHLQVRDGGVLITEYYGLVPSRLLPGKPTPGEAGMVEAMVTIANESILLKAVRSPYTMKDRPIIAYQHESVQGEFWGRGVCEKGYNPQKALDAELRARIDALALLTAPMMGADITRLPRNPDMRVRPGATIFTRGRPSEIYEAVSFGDPGVLSATFQQAGDMERMVQMATGAMDTATPLSTARRNETASGMSMMNSGFIKRSKRVMGNVDRHFLSPLVRKALWRYVQFSPDRYPQDMKFRINATMGIMAKEVENSQLINMLGFLPEDQAAHAIVVQAIFDNSASSNKKELMEALKQATAPPSEEEQQMQQQVEQLKLQMAVAQLEKEKAEIEKLKAETMLAIEKAKHEAIEADLEDDLVDIQASNAAVAAQKTRNQAKQNDVALARVAVEREKAKAKSQSTD